MVCKMTSKLMIVNKCGKCFLIFLYSSPVYTHFVLQASVSASLDYSPALVILDKLSRKVLLVSRLIISLVDIQNLVFCFCSLVIIEENNFQLSMISCSTLLQRHRALPNSQKIMHSLLMSQLWSWTCLLQFYSKSWRSINACILE